MQKAYIVVGAGYGDESKGLTTDHLCHQLSLQGEAVVNVRANGGAQAGHTVELPTGERHVFKHFGAGSFTGAKTYLTTDFVVNPIAFRQEREELLALGLAPQVYVSRAAQVTLPLDMMVNQWLESQRGTARHGSCGWGVNETVVRGLRGAALAVGQLPRLDLAKMYQFSAASLRPRLTELGYDPDALDDDWRARFSDARVMRKFIEDCQYFSAHTTTLPDQRLRELGSAVVFEGAQGLGLDEEWGHFPYVTRSHTGSRNPLRVCESVGIDSVEVVYATRCYATRHGAGPLEHEGARHGATIVDPTNMPNQWQGTLRSAPLDVDLLARRAQQDWTLPYRGNKKASLMTSCLDQITDQVTVILDGNEVETTSQFVPLLVATRLTHRTGRLSKVLMSRGPTRQTVTDWSTM